MDLCAIRRPPHSLPGEEKHQMLNLNRRLENYLSRVKVLEEENMLLTQEIQALRHGRTRASAHRRGLEEELRRARLEVDAAWRDRVHTELEVSKLTEELQALDLHRQKEAQAQVEAKTKLEQSRKELEEEHRAQIWLREKVAQLEEEMKQLRQTHLEDVTHLETTLTHSRTNMFPNLAQRSDVRPNLHQLEKEFSLRTTRAWQEAADAYEGQLAHLEESLNQTRIRLAQVGQEKTESQVRLQALEREVASAQDVQVYLERRAAQQRDQHQQGVQMLQEHLEGLEAEKRELGQQVDHLVQEIRGLLQLKMSLGLEVATYRALMDSESLGGDVSLINKPRNIFQTDAFVSPLGLKENYQMMQPPAGHKTISFSSLCGRTGRSKIAVINAASFLEGKPVGFTEIPKVSRKHVNEDATQSASWGTPYPKILQDGAVEHFRPQEINEKVTHAEPLSPPNEPEDATENTFGTQGEKNNWTDVDVPEEKPATESAASYQVESGLSTKLPCSDDTGRQQSTTSSLTPFRMTEEPRVPSRMSAEELQHTPFDAWAEKETTGKDAEQIQEETSDSETDALLEPTLESRTSSPASECEPEEGVFHQASGFSRDDSIFKEDAEEMEQDSSCSMAGTSEVNDKLYPDGEEMDTWDSVMERKGELKADDSIIKAEVKQFAEPEEDISVRKPEDSQREMKQDSDTGEQQNDNMAYSVADTQEDWCTEQVPDPDDEDDEEEEDSQNVSVSWRTELESDSYALDNTLADTRPLIRYKSDETDANTQASHMDESESSEGEQEKRVGEAGSAAWSESKSKRFGTMEDLCEEVEGEALDEEYDLGYTQVEDKEDKNACECTTLANESECTEEMAKKGSEAHLDEESEDERAKPDIDEELEIDRLVEEELENLSTENYSAHFGQQQANESNVVHSEYAKETAKQEEARGTEMSPCTEPNNGVNHQFASATTSAHRPYQNLFLSDASVLTHPTSAVEEAQNNDQEATGGPEKTEEEDEKDFSTQTNVAVLEGHFSKFIIQSDEEIYSADDPKFTLHLTGDGDGASLSQENVVEGVPEVLETAEWEVLENPSEDDEIRDHEEGDEIRDNVPASVESLQHDGGTRVGVITEEAKPPGIHPESLPEEPDIFVVKDSTKLSTNGKDGSIHGFLTPGVMDDLWVSSLETPASFHPDNAANNEAVEKTNKNLRFSGSPLWGHSGNPNGVNGTSRVEMDTSNAEAPPNVQEQSEVTQVLCRNLAEAVVVHSEESESWSSGEE